MKTANPRIPSPFDTAGMLAAFGPLTPAFSVKQSESGQPLELNWTAQGFLKLYG